MAERENVVDFTVPYYDLVGISILMKKPEVKIFVFKIKFRVRHKTHIPYKLKFGGLAWAEVFRVSG